MVCIKVGLSSSGNVILCGYQQALSPVSWLQDVITEMHRLQGSKAVLSILPISLLCGKYTFTHCKLCIILSSGQPNVAGLK